MEWAFERVAGPIIRLLPSTEFPNDGIMLPERFLNCPLGSMRALI